MAQNIVTINTNEEIVLDNVAGDISNSHVLEDPVKENVISSSHVAENSVQEGTVCDILLEQTDPCTTNDSYSLQEQNETCLKIDSEENSMSSTDVTSKDFIPANDTEQCHSTSNDCAKSPLPEYNIPASIAHENVKELSYECPPSKLSNVNGITQNLPSENASQKFSNVIDNKGYQVSDVSSSHSSSPAIHHEISDAENTILDRAKDHIRDLEIKNARLENDLSELRLKLHAQELGFRQAELENKAEFLNKIEKLSKEINTLHKEKEMIVVRYANSEKEVLLEKKAQQELEKKIKDLHKDRENLLSRIKNLTTENSKLSASCESKMTEISKLQKNFDKLNTDFYSREIRIKWLQNKLVNETGSHQETQTKLEQTVHRLNEMKEEAEQVRKDCQEMIRCYQEAEEIKSVKLDSQLKQKLSELEVQKQEKLDQEQVYQLLRQELEALKKKQRLTMEENNTLTLKIQNLEQERLEYGQNLSKLKDSQNLLKEEIVDLTARLAEMETLQLQLEREKEKSAASLREIERLRLTNAELQADMNACHLKEGELLKFTEGVTDTNVKLQSAHSLLEVRAQALDDELGETKRLLADVQQRYQELVPELECTKKNHEEEVQLLARKLAEKAKIVEKLNTRLDEFENENRVLKRRHIASIKELSRELYECKKRLDNYETTNGTRIDSASLGSRSSSTVSLDVINSNENRFRAVTPPPPTVSFNGKGCTPNESYENSSSDMPEIDKEMLIERIIKLQKTLARRNDKIDFLEDHIEQLVKEMRKKSKCVDLKTV